MMGLTQGAEPSESKAVFDLLAIVSDPAAAKKRLDELLKTLADAKESVVKADAREKVLLKIDQETAGRVNAVISAERVVEARSKELEQKSLPLNKMKDNVASREAALAKAKEDFAEEVKKRKASLKEQEKTLAAQVKAGAATFKAENEKLDLRTKRLNEAEALKSREEIFDSKKKAVESALRAASV